MSTNSSSTVGPTVRGGRVVRGRVVINIVIAANVVVLAVVVADSVIEVVIGAYIVAVVIFVVAVVLFVVAVVIFVVADVIFDIFLSAVIVVVVVFLNASARETAPKISAAITRLFADEIGLEFSVSRFLPLSLFPSNSSSSGGSFPANKLGGLYRIDIP